MNINMHDQDSRDVVFIVLGFIMAIVSVLMLIAIDNEILPLRFLFFGLVTVPFTVNGFAHLIYFMGDRFKAIDQNLFLSLICLAVTIISAVIGGISYVNDHNFILRGLEAELIWFFISLPSLVMTVIHFIFSFIKKSKKIKNN